MMKRLVILSFLFADISVGQHVGLSARTDSAHYRIGDWINVRVEGTVSTDVDTVAPAVADSIGPFEVLAIERNATKPEWNIRLMTVDSGDVFVPPIPFAYRVQGDSTLRKAFTNALHLTITRIAVDPQGEIKDIKPPVSAPWLFEDLLPYIVGIVLLAAAGVGYYYYRKKQKEREAAYIPPKSKIAPHIAALYALRELEDKKLWQNGKVKQYYSEVTGIIRTFFEGRWNIIALELTSDEILHQMKRFPESEPVWKQLRSFLITADLVKFAKYMPSPEENENELRWAYDIVRAMTPAPTTVEEEQSAEETHAR
jgi:hypothetical protein